MNNKSNYTINTRNDKQQNDDKYILLLLIVYFVLYNISVKQSKDHVPDKSIYCGTKRIPAGYGRYGSRYECLRRGFGAGMYRNETTYPYRKWGLVLLITIALIVLYRILILSNNK